jgi:hypothetical protein
MTGRSSVNSVSNSRSGVRVLGVRDQPHQIDHVDHRDPQAWQLGPQDRGGRERLQRGHVAGTGQHDGAMHLFGLWRHARHVVKSPLGAAYRGGMRPPVARALASDSTNGPVSGLGHDVQAGGSIPSVRVGRVRVHSRCPFLGVPAPGVSASTAGGTHCQVSRRLVGRSRCRGQPRPVMPLVTAASLPPRASARPAHTAAETPSTIGWGATSRTRPPRSRNCWVPSYGSGGWGF